MRNHIAEETEHSKHHFRSHPALASFSCIFHEPKLFSFPHKHTVIGLQMGPGAAPAGFLPLTSMGAETALFLTVFEHKRNTIA